MRTKRSFHYSSRAWLARPTRKLLAVRVFDDKTKRVAYTKQTQEAQDKGKSNCPLCAIGEHANKPRV